MKKKKLSFKVEFDIVLEKLEFFSEGKDKYVELLCSKSQALKQYPQWDED